MNKKNHMLARIQAKHEVEMARMQYFVMQQCHDMMCIAASEFGMGPEEIQKFCRLYETTMMEYADCCLHDAEGDKEIWYTKEKVDQRLRNACGDLFVPWEERYRF